MNSVPVIAALAPIRVVLSFGRLNYLFARYSDLSACCKEDGVKMTAQKMT
jgi:hypothetical protein